LYAAGGKVSVYPLIQPIHLDFRLKVVRDDYLALSVVSRLGFIST
jgi:hypothetical protein